MNESSEKKAYEFIRYAQKRIQITGKREMIRKEVKMKGKSVYLISRAF